MLVDGDLVVWNNKLTLDDKNLVGQEIASLGELAHHHIPIIHRIVITPLAFKKFLSDNKLDTQIKHLLGSLNHERVDSISQVANYIKRVILKSEIKDDIYKTFFKYYEEMRSKNVTLSAYYFKDGSIIGKEKWDGLNGETVVIEHLRIAYSHLFSPGYLRRQTIHHNNHHTFSVCLVVEPDVKFELTGEVRTFGKSRGEYEIEAHSMLKLVYNKHKEMFEKGYVPSGGNKDILSIPDIKTLLEYAKKIEKALYLPFIVYWGKYGNEFLATKALPATEVFEEDNTYKNLRNMITVHPGITIGRLKVVDGKSKSEIILNDEIIILKKLDKGLLESVKKVRGLILREEPHPEITNILKSFGIPTVISKDNLLYSTGDVVSLNATTGEIKRGSMLVS